MKIKTMMMLTISGCFIHSADAVTMSGCGDYLIEGFVRKDKSRAIIVINEKSVSEIRIEAPFNWETKLQAYLEKPITAQIEIQKTMNGTIGELYSIQNIEMRVPDPINQKFDKIKLLKKAECK